MPDQNPQQRFKEIISCFEKVQQYFALPDQSGNHLPRMQDKINVGIYLLPNNKDIGGLETLCWNALKGKKKYVQEKKACVESYMDCLGEKDIDQSMTSNNINKSKFRIYRATPNPDGQVHDLLDAVDIQSSAWRGLITFIRQANR